MENFTLELLHIADQEAGAAAVVDAPNLSAVLQALDDQDLGADGLVDNTLRLSSGDAFIPGVFFDAGEAVFGSAGIADIEIQNQLGLQAIALGNHEFDLNTPFLAGLIDGSATGDIFGADFTGTDFPYLSTNLDFSTDSNLDPLVVAGGQAPQSNSISSSTVIDVNGEMIGVVGATTPRLGSISSPGDVTILPEGFDNPPTDAQLDALAAEIQLEVDALLADNPGLNKIILLSHMQQISIEQALATRLTDVDIIVAGGSNTRLFDENDRPRDGDSDQGDYPGFFTDGDGNPVAVVNTDGSYKYVGRLVIEFDANGNIIPGSYDPNVSGAYATDAQGVADLNAEGLIDPEIQAIADAIEAQIIATESNVFGVSDVFLNANRSGAGAPNDPDGVRTQETNLGNLTADANLVYAQQFDDSVVISIKNGGGIRANIGEIVVPAGGTEAVRTPNAELIDSDGNLIKPEGGISQTDIVTTLAFNNGLVLVTATKTELKAILEQGVSALPNPDGGISSDGQFPQVAGIRYSFDLTREVGDRIVSAVVVNEETDEIIDVLVKDGQIVGDADKGFRIVTLDFLANFQELPIPNADRVDLETATRTGAATFADDGTEQDAFAEYLASTFPDADNAFAEADGGPESDLRIQQIEFRDDAIFDDALMGTDRNEGLRGDDEANDVIFAGGGRDNVRGRDGDDVLFGEEGRDRLRGDDGDDTLVGGLGNDRLIGGDGDDVMTGGDLGGPVSEELERREINVFVTGDGNDTITDFDLRNDGERWFDKVKITGQGKLNGMIRTEKQLIKYIERIESDGDRGTDAVKDGDDLVLVFRREDDGDLSSADNLVDSVRLENLFGDSENSALLDQIETALGRELDVFDSIA